MREGDFFLWSGTERIDRLIQWGTRSRWNHAGIVVPQAADGTNIIQALHTGVARARIDTRDPARYRVVDSGLDERGRYYAVARAEGFLGFRYNDVAILSYALACILPTRFYFSYDGVLTCSQLVAKCLIAGGAPLTMDDDRYRPVDLAVTYGVARR